MNLLRSVVMRALLATSRAAPDLSPLERQIVRQVRPFTMTSRERIVALIHAVQHVVRHCIPGEIVECGVWQGGSMMAAALTLVDLKDTDRDLYLFDTFTGMPTATESDVQWDGRRPTDIAPNGGWVSVSTETVVQNLMTTGFNLHRVHLIPGLVEETIPQHAPEVIAVLRLDTDFHASTAHELAHLWPRLAPGGICIVDDYGHWRGCREAVDDFLTTLEPPAFLHRIDYSGRLLVKPHHAVGRGSEGGV